jgi:hypothetical protein
MALALRFEQLLCEGKIRNYAELARLGHVSRARVSQIMRLLSLAPTIQEALLTGAFGEVAFSEGLQAPGHAFDEPALVASAGGFAEEGAIAGA